jgi:dTDP-4-dehydrorhamnose reductase
MAKILITGANGFIGNYLSTIYTNAIAITRSDCDLTNWEEVLNFKWNGDVIINCAHIGKYSEDKDGYLEKNILLMSNLRRRWPKTKIINFGSGAMFDKSKPIVKAKETDVIYPLDLYGLSKRMTVDVADVTLIIFGLFSNSRFVKSVLDHIANNEPVIIYQDVLYSWVNLIDLPGVIDWAILNGKGKYNLCGYDMLISKMAIYLGAKDISYQKIGLANEYTGNRNNIIKLNKCPNF